MPGVEVGSTWGTFAKQEFYVPVCWCWVKSHINASQLKYKIVHISNTDLKHEQSDIRANFNKMKTQPTALSSLDFRGGAD